MNLGLKSFSHIQRLRSRQKFLYILKMLLRSLYLEENLKRPRKEQLRDPYQARVQLLSKRDLVLLLNML